MVEERVDELEARIARMERRMRALEAGRRAGLRVPGLPRPSLPGADQIAGGRRLPRPAVPDLEQLLGGRVLAWLGGAAVLVGLAFLLALAIRNGWLGELARTLLAAGASLVLVGGGVALHERRGRTEAARAMFGTGLAGVFLTLAVATRAYDLIPAVAALPLAFATGAAATALAVRWHARAIAGLGIVGAILAPALTGAGFDASAMAFLAVAVACATAVVLWRRWNWLALAAFAAATPQWLVYLAEETRPGRIVGVLTVFGTLFAVAALGYEVRVPAPSVRRSSAFLVVLNAVVLAVAGYAALYYRVSETAGVAWLAGLAVAHALAAAALAARAPAARDARHLCLVLAVLVADAGLAIATDGAGRAIAFAAASVGFAALARRLRAPGEGNARGLAELGLGGHVGLALVQALAQIDLADVGSPGVAGEEMAALLALAAACLVSGRLASGGREQIRVALHSAGLAAVALVAALALDGAALTAAWAAEAVTLAGIARRTGDPVARAGALVHLGAAALWAVADQAPVDGLADGGTALGAAALGLGAGAGATVLVARASERPLRSRLLVAAGLVVLYFASLAAAAAPQGQLDLSTLWAVTGVVELIAGLSLVADAGMGLEPGEARRAALVAVELASLAGEPDPAEHWNVVERLGLLAQRGAVPALA